MRKLPKRRDPILQTPRYARHPIDLAIVENAELKPAQSLNPMFKGFRVKPPLP